MSTVTITDGGTVTHDPSDSRVYVVDWDANNLATSVTISASTFTITAIEPSGDTGLTKDNASILSGSRKTQVRLIGGTSGARYRIDNRITTSESPSQTKERSFFVLVQDR